MKRLLLIALLVMGLAHFAQKKTDRFTLSKVATHLLKKPCSEIDDQLLSKSYLYLGKGGQSYVFASEDGQYVLKVFRGSRLGILQFLSRFSTHFASKKTQVEHDLEKTLKSYQLAFEKLREETGLVAIHLDGHEPLPGELKIIDNLKIRHTMDPNLIPFIIQKRATLVKEKIAQNPSKKYLKDLLALLRLRMEAGIEDTDPNLAKNFGFVGERAVQIDPGRFSKSSHPSMQRLERSKEDLKHWLNANHPELSEDFDTLFEEFCREAI